MIALFPLEVKVREFMPKIFLAYQLIRNHNFQIILSKSRFLTNQLPYLRNAIYFDKSMSYEKEFILNKVKKENFYSALDEEGPMVFWPKFFFDTRLNDRVISKSDSYFLRGKDELNVIKKNKVKIKKDILKIVGHPKYDLLKPKVKHIFDKEVFKIKDKFKNFVLISSSFFIDVKEGEENFIKFTKEKYVNNKEQKKSYDILKKKWKFDNQNYLSMIELIKILSGKFPNINFVFRPHPIQDIKKVKKRFKNMPSNFFIEYNYSITPWIIACKYFFHSHCTTSYEASILNKKILTLNTSKKGHAIPYMTGYNFSNISNFVNFFKNLETSKKIYNYKKNNLPKKFIYNSNKSTYSSEQIARQFKKILRNKKSKYVKPNLSYIKIFFKNIEDFCKNLISNSYLFFGFKKRSNEKFKNTSAKEILDCLNLFQLYAKNKINFKVEKIEHQVFLLKKL